MDAEEFHRMFSELTDLKPNPYHPLVWINGEPEFGEGIYIGGFSVINAKGARVAIGDYCDIASFVSINVADSHRRCIGLADSIARADIVLEDHVFVGSHSVIMGGSYIGHHSVVGAGTVVSRCNVPPYSLVVGNPMTIREGYYREKILGAGLDER